MDDQRDTGASRPWYLLGGLMAAAVFLLAAWNIELPFLAFSAGPTTDAANAVIAEDVPVYPPEGELLMLTVVSQNVNVFEALIVALDPKLDLVPRAAYRTPDESDEHYRERVLQQMDDSQQVSIAVALSQLGYQMVPSDVVITSVSEAVPASSVLKAGDSLKSLDGQPIVDLSDVTAALAGHRVGDIIEVGLERDGSPLTVQVELADRGDEVGGPMIGITVEEIRTPPFPISFAAGVVGGPSAGMMNTLAVIDTLTPGEMTRGHIIAGTGTIQPDGTVGNIGGVRQKVVGAEAAGAEYVLVPQGNYDEALTADADAIKIVPIGTLTEAISFLESLPDVVH